MAPDAPETLWLHAQRQVTIVDLSLYSGLPEERLRELVELGALSPAERDAAEWRFGAECIARVRAAARLSDDLELDTASLALVLSFLERITLLEEEIRHLHAQLPTPRR